MTRSGSIIFIAAPTPHALHDLDARREQPRKCSIEPEDVAGNLQDSLERIRVRTNAGLDIAARVLTLLAICSSSLKGVRKRHVLDDVIHVYGVVDTPGNLAQEHDGCERFGFAASESYSTSWRSRRYSIPFKNSVRFFLHLSNLISGIFPYGP